MRFSIIMLLILVWLGATEARSDALHRAQMAGLASSERLRLFTLGRAMAENRGAPALRGAMREALVASAFYHDESAARIIARDLHWSPVLDWDANINGGYTNDRFDLFGLSFAVDPSRTAISGMVAGARGGGRIRLAYGNGRYLELNGSLEAVHAPRHGVGRAQAGASACSRNHLRGWTFADFCVSASRSWRSLAISGSASATASIAQIFAAGEGFHEVSLGVARHFLAGGAQNAATLGWEAVWNRAVTGLSLTVAEPIAGENALRHRLSADVSWRLGERPVTLGVWHAQASGGMLLGAPREDSISGVRVSFQQRPNLTLELSHQVTRSSINLFDEARTGLSVRFQLGRRG